jgi:hypothetical protein
MKKGLIISISLLVTFHLPGQEIGISVGPTINNAFYFQFVAGGPTFRTKIGFNSAIDYKFLLNKKLNLGLDLNLQYCPVEVVPQITVPPIPNDQPRHTEKINLLSISPRVVYKFKNGFYTSLAPTLTYHTNYEKLKDYVIQTIDNQTGLGLSLSFGKYFKITNHLFLNIEPKLFIHNIIPFQNENLPLRVTTIGLNCGIALRREKNQEK